MQNQLYGQGDIIAADYERRCEGERTDNTATADIALLKAYYAHVKALTSAVERALQTAGNSVADDFELLQGVLDDEIKGDMIPTISAIADRQDDEHGTGCADDDCSPDFVELNRLIKNLALVGVG
ncbi:MAG: hypothetical protein K2Q12_08180 [Rickettsiales bacterium]|nr:hypothetical protein [Rickettsiales bacterium]